MWTSTQKIKLESTDVILSSSHEKKMVYLVFLVVLSAVVDTSMVYVHQRYFVDVGFCFNFVFFKVSVSRCVCCFSSDVPVPVPQLSCWLLSFRCSCSLLPFHFLLLLFSLLRDLKK